MLTRKGTSPVWENVDARVATKENGKDVVKMQCKLCGMQLAHGGGTTSLALHLSAEHTRSFGDLASLKKQTTLPIKQLFSSFLLNAPSQLLG